MAKTAALTVRLPKDLKTRLESRAEAEHRSLSAQVVVDLTSLVDTTPTPTEGSGRFLGMFAGTRVPSEADFAEVRQRLWGNLPRDDWE